MTTEERWAIIAADPVLREWMRLLAEMLAEAATWGDEDELQEATRWT